MATSMGDDDDRVRGDEGVRGDERLGAGDDGGGGPDVEHDPEAARAANRFDIRRIIGGVFLLYGVVLVILGIFGTEEIKNKAAGINVNLWTGLAMLAVGALMVTWALKRPVAPTHPRPARERGSYA